MVKNCDLGQHFQDLGHSFSPYGPPSRQITYIYYWLVMPIQELKITLSHDFNAAALRNMDQPTSSESSATFTDQNSMYPRNDFPKQEWNIIPGRSAASTNSDIRIPQNIAAAGTCRSKWVYISHYKQRCMSYD